MNHNFIWLAVWLLTIGCNSKTETPSSYPSHFPASLSAPNNNPSTVLGVALGRMLFHDPTLSPKGNVACSSCHIPSFHFGDTVSLSAGHQGETTHRNTPPLLNMAWSPLLFWDGGGLNIESVSLTPLHNESEMGWKDLALLEQRLRASPSYRELFSQAFGTQNIEIAHVLRALAQYQRSLIHAESRWDKWILRQGELTKPELEGWSLFQKQCAGCHKPPLFTNYAFYKVSSDVLPDTLPLDHAARGRNRITQKLADLGKYRTPTLRGLGKTYPYFHDGRFLTIEDLMQSPGFDNLHAGKPMTNQEKQLLISFLNTLN